MSNTSGLMPKDPHVSSPVAATQGGEWNCTQLQVNGFAAQIGHIVNAYLNWSVVNAEEGRLGSSYELPKDVDVQERWNVLVIDVFSSSRKDICLNAGNAYVVSTCVRWGWMPISSYLPIAVIAIRTLEVYRVTHLRCLQLGIQVFMCILCDIHGVVPCLCRMRRLHVPELLSVEQAVGAPRPPTG
ncbi:hypothetical protein C8R44DRAFT_877138 [Mycena epipterygia]|nr:hypothetical protein C8R44DRAFT_877138 [Mycena epipterygia]